MAYKIEKFGNVKNGIFLAKRANKVYSTFEEAQLATEKYFRYEVRQFRNKNRKFCEGLDKADLYKAAERSGKINLYRVCSAVGFNPLAA